MGLAFGTFSIGRISVARTSALLCWILWTRVHATRTDLLLLQVDRPRPDRFDKRSLHHAAELPTPPPFAGGARQRHAQPRIGGSASGYCNRRAARFARLVIALGQGANFSAFQPRRNQGCSSTARSMSAMRKRVPFEQLLPL